MENSICLTETDFEMSDTLKELFAEEINNFLADTYGQTNRGWAYEINLSEIDWDEE